LNPNSGGKEMDYISKKLGFSITLPEGWKVDEETLSAEVDKGEIGWEEAYERFQKTFPDSGLSFEEFKAGPKELSVEEAYKMSKAGLERMGVGIVSFDEFKDIYEYEQEEKRERARKRQEMDEMMIGYFDASLHNEEICEREREEGKESIRKTKEEEQKRGFVGLTYDEQYQLYCPPTVEVTKYQLKRPMTPLELYQLDKGTRPLAAPGSSRPWRGIVIDGLKGEKYCYGTGWGGRLRGEDSMHLNIYLVDGPIGWIISCSCSGPFFERWKGTFVRIIESFHRLK
jgi:hypothetical protein